MDRKPPRLPMLGTLCYLMLRLNAFKRLRANTAPE
jgi:hypothetical protein